MGDGRLGIGLLETIEKISNSLSTRILTGLLPVVHTYWALAASVYLLWWLIDRGLLRGTLNTGEATRLLLSFILIETFLISAPLYEEYLFLPIKQVGFKLTEICIRGGSFSESISSIQDIMASLGAEIEHVSSISKSLAQGGTVFNPMYAIIALLFSVLLFFMWFLFFAVVIEYQFCFTIFACLSPLAVGLFFFKATRSFSLQIFRLPFFGGLVMALSALSMSFVFEVFRFGTKKIPIDAAGEISGAAEKWVFSGSFYELVLGLLLGIFLLLKAHAIAGKIAQFDISVGANAGFAALASASSVGISKGAGAAYGGISRAYILRKTRQEGG